MADKPQMIETLDCHGALGVVLHQRAPATGRALATMILNAARQQHPDLVHPEASVPR